MGMLKKKNKERKMEGRRLVFWVPLGREDPLGN
jgi:hypothetical protein